MSYAPDKGGIFGSDVHRRIQANVPSPDETPLSVADLITQRINNDPHLLLQLTDPNEVVAVLKELEAEGHAKQDKQGRWQNTADGFAALTGPVVEADGTQPAPAMLDIGGLDPNG